jgi:hypothetical protein
MDPRNGAEINLAFLPLEDLESIVGGIQLDFFDTANTPRWEGHNSIAPFF